MGRGRIRTAAAALTVVVLVLIGAPAVFAQADDVGLITYRVDLESRSIAVRETLDMAVRTDTITTYVPVEAVDLSSSATLSRQPFDDFLDQVTLSTTASTVTLEYRLTSTSRQDEGARVNDSFIGFTILPSHQTDDVVIQLPPGFRANEDPELFDAREVDKDTYEYESEYAQDLWGYWFIALAGAGLETRTVDTGEDVIEVVAWAGDREWLDFTERYVRDGVPVLRELIGQPWPEENLQIVESVEPTQFGYAGWYSLRESQIEIPDQVDAETLLHELSHAWFNDRFYSGRWMVEGFAEEMASESLERLDGLVTDPDAPGTPPAGFDGLAKWRSRFFFEDTWELEYFGYETSWYVIDALADEIGAGGMTEVIGAMQDGRATYGLDGEPVLYPANDWRRFLDMLELRGGSEQAGELFRTWVVPSDEVVLLNQRADAIKVFDTFAADDLAAVPLGIRDAMSRWQFAEARSQMATAELIRADVAELADRAAALDLLIPAVIDDLYRAAGPDYSRVRRVIDRTDTLLRAFELDPEALDDANRRNFQAGRFERIDVDVSAVERSFDRQLNQNRQQSNTLGYLYGATLIGLLVVGSGVWLLLRRLQQAGPSTGAPTGDAGGGPPPPPPTAPQPPPRPHATSSPR